MGRCRGTTQQGGACRNPAGEHDYCWRHSDQEYDRYCSYGREPLDFCNRPGDRYVFDPPFPLRWPVVSLPPANTVAPENPVPEPAPAPEFVIPTPGYPVPTNVRVPDVQVRNGMRCFSYNALYQATKRFSADCLLGSGGYGKVHAGVLRTSKLGIAGLEPTTKVAIKMLDPASLQGEDHFRAEVRSLTHLMHANIVPLYGICDEHSGLVYPRLSSSVLDKLKTADSRSMLPGKACVKIGIDAAAGLQYLHSEGFVHRDIKPGNILLDDKGLAHLADFGLVRKMDNEGTNTNPVGTIGFMDPEYLETETLTKASDIYSLGCVLALLGSFVARNGMLM